MISTRILIVATATVLSMYTSSASGAAGTTKIANVAVTEGAAYVYAASPLTNWAACATYGSQPAVNRLAINISTPQGRAMLNAALLALATNKTVNLVGRGSMGTPLTQAEICNVQTGDETLNYLIVAAT